MTQIVDGLARALRDGMARLGAAEVAYCKINDAFHSLAVALTEVTAESVMIGRLSDQGTGRDMDERAAACLGGSYPIFVRPTGDPGFVVLVGLLSTAPTGFPVELRVDDRQHVATGVQELSRVLLDFASSPSVARAVIACAAHIPAGTMPTMTARQ